MDLTYLDIYASSAERSAYSSYLNISSLETPPPSQEGKILCIFLYFSPQSLHCPPAQDYFHTFVP